MKKILATLLFTMIIISLCACGSGGTERSSSSNTAPIEAKVTDDGTAYIVVPDGETVVIEEASFAALSADRNHMVVLLKDGTLYYSDINQKEKTQVSDSASTIRSIKNEGFFYSDSNSKTYRVTFSDAASVELGENIALSVAQNSLSALYSTQDGDIYTMPYTSSEANKVSTYSGRVYLNDISDDGQISVWTTKDNDALTLYLNEDDEKTTLGMIDLKYDSNYDSTYVTFTNDQNLAVITNLHGDQLYIKKRGEEAIKVKLGNTLQSATVYTNQGLLSQQDSSKVENLYILVDSDTDNILVDSDTDNNVYCITLTGERERVLSKVKFFAISNGKILYVDSDSDLYYAKITALSTSDDKKIASDVDYMKLSENGSYLYYMKDCSDNIYPPNSGTLYCYKVGEDESKKVGSDVGCFYTLYGHFQIGMDGSTVYYLKDIETIADVYFSYGTLYSWTYSEGESVKISSDVMERSLSSALLSGVINSKGFTYQKYSSIDSDQNIHVDLYYWNGTEGSRIAQDVKW